MECNANGKESVGLDVLNYDLEIEFSEFISTKAGVKGLVDSGIVKVPRFFLSPAGVNYLEQTSSNGIVNQVPVINLEGYGGKRRRTIVNEVLQASRTWGMFQVFNHGVPSAVMKSMLESVCGFHEQSNELKKDYYSHDSTRKVWYYATIQPAHKTAVWKDTIACQFENMTEDFEALPLICREPMFDYVKHIVELKGRLCKLLSEAVGLEGDLLELMECMEPRKDQWIHVPPMEGALIVIIGDMLQLISNDLLRSAEHRVLANWKGPRLSAACFFYPNGRNKDRNYGPIEELLSDKNPALYKEITHAEYLKHHGVHGSCGSKALPHIKL
ncbi:1-aminocyclopropane-1-carboxylate oxidase homolog 9-like isoform X2 [Chenopodium quinoa]|uniref:1-aminocyclopropane-1-carboxylate oxidase homolog 9-like isoform X2 n=1 Tax=Chenopodium quinoa TaxID=63459 RepID=UPI000B79557D|nr:1-aminocyclopropane-1-carboxylate oxidase homolog 9-like isoform X2 [Chenopodium quinoa]